jgi:hypothetical protein
MKVTIELRNGPHHDHHVTARDVDRNIAALRRAVDGKPLACDMVLLMDTISVLEAIRAALPKRGAP